MSPRSKEYRILLDEILDHDAENRRAGLPGLEEDEWRSLGEIVNGVLAKIQPPPKDDPNPFE
jgi:hypothetical protein